MKIPKRPVLILDSGHRCRRSRHENIDDAITSAQLGEPPLDLRAEIDHVSMTPRLNHELTVMNIHRQSITR